VKFFLFLDFDGVLFDTVKEAYFIAYKAYYGNDVSVVDYEHYELFKKYRYLIGPAWNYYYLFQVLKNKNIEQEYYHLISTSSKEKYDRFEKTFFAARELFKKTNYNKWLKLNKPYHFLFRLVDLLKNYYLITYIVTTKDKQTVLDLLYHNSISVFDESRILDKDFYNQFGSKCNIIKSMLQDVEEYKAIFIDDLDIHLQKCESIRHLTLIQAQWGYVNPNMPSVLSYYALSEANALKFIQQYIV